MLSSTYSCRQDRTRAGAKKSTPSQVTTPKERPASDPALQRILDRCSLDFFKPGTVFNRRMGYEADYSVIFRKAILHLYYAKYLRVGEVRLPQEHVRACLEAMDWGTLYDARNKIEHALEKSRYRMKIRNSSAYARTVVYNCIAETQSDALLGVG